MTANFSRHHHDDAFQPLPKPSGTFPFRLELEDILDAEAVAAIAQRRKMVFQTVGDTGNARYGAEAQDAVAEHLVRQREQLQGADRPLFFYHLGDVVYYNGERRKYEPQFYDPYVKYTSPIFAIAGNHDGAVVRGDTPLQGFMENFCARQPVHTWMAGQSNRTTMTQPNCYWTLLTPLATIIGLYSNVTGRLDQTDRTQLQWLIDELRAAAGARCVIVAVHHPPYSLDDTHGGHDAIRVALDTAFAESGRVPDLVLTGHVHNYQRFERTLPGNRRLQYVVAGAGGFAGYTALHQLKDLATADLPTGVRLAAHQTKNPGFLTLSVTHDAIDGTYYTVDRAVDPSETTATAFETFTVPLG